MSTARPRTKNQLKEFFKFLEANDFNLEFHSKACCYAWIKENHRYFVYVMNEIVGSSHVFSWEILWKVNLGRKLSENLGTEIVGSYKIMNRQIINNVPQSNNMTILEKKNERRVRMAL